MENSKKSLNILLFEIGIWMIPYDAMHVMPSTYAPISVYAFFLSLLITLVNRKGKLYIWSYVKI